MEKTLRIMMCGPSGIGKTTIGNFISETYGIPFISGSYSDLVPSTKEVKHVDMMAKSPDKLYSEEHQLLSIRSRLFGLADNQLDGFVSDRSYIDNLAYFLYKLGPNIKQCDTQTFVDNVVQLLNNHCSHLIFVPYTDSSIKDWSIEDNNKRVLNVWFQWTISQIMEGIIRYFGYYPRFWWNSSGKLNLGKNFPWISTNEIERDIKVLILSSLDKTEREQRIKNFLK